MESRFTLFIDHQGVYTTLENALFDLTKEGTRLSFPRRVARSAYKDILRGQLA